MNLGLQRPEKLLSSAQEQEYRASCWRWDTYAIAISFMICLGLLFSTFWGDMLIISNYQSGISTVSISTLFLLIGWRAVVMVLTLAFGMWVYRHRHIPRLHIYDRFLFAWMLAFISLLLFSEITRPASYYTGAVLQMGLVVMMYFVLPQHNLYFRTSPPLLFTIGFIYIYATFKQPPAFFGFASIYAGFLAVNVVGFIVSYIVHTTQRHQFALNQEKDQLVALLTEGKRELEQKNQELEREKELVAGYEAELRRRAVQREKMRTLQAQIKPHFLYNSLSTIGYYCRNQPDQAYNLISNLAIYLQGAFKLQSETVDLETEMELVRAYLCIESARMEERLKIEITIDGEFSDCQLPPFSLQPLVGNAVRHGLSPLIDGGTLKIIAEEEADGYYFQVTDNGVGIAAERQANLLDSLKKDSGSGIGLSNVHERLMGLFGNGLTIESQPGCGTSVSFSIPRRLKELEGIPD